MPTVTLGAIIIDDTALRKRIAEFSNDQVPFAMATAINDLAWDTIRIEKLDMLHVFDRPTPFVLSGLKMAKKATKKEARPTAAIWFGEGFRDRSGGFVKGKIQQSEVLENIVRPHIEGGGRNRKSTEKRLREIGVLKPGEWMIPAFQAKRDRYGNIPGSRYVEVLSYFRAFREAGFNANRGSRAPKLRSGVKFWIMPITGDSRGIVETRNGGPPKLVFYLTTAKPTYRRGRFDFYGNADRHARKFGAHFAEQAMKRALASAR